jgi:hypothetical protein
LLDAVAKALDLLKARERGHRSVLIVIGESKDRGSETKLEDLLPQVQGSGITVYSLAYSAYLTPLTTKASEYHAPEGGHGWIIDSVLETIHATRPDTCKLLVGASGGSQLKFETRSKLEDDLIKLGSEIHSRYMISFVPVQQEKEGFHRLNVTVKGHPEFRVAARPGYSMISGAVN